MKTESGLIQEANDALLRGFNSIDQTWRKYATRNECESFAAKTYKAATYNSVSKDAAGNTYASFINTYAKLFSFKESEVVSCSHIRKIIGMGRGAALRFNDVFWGEVSRCGGPSWPEGVKSANASKSMPSLMDRIHVTVHFLNGVEHPVIDAVQCQSGMVDFRGYFDFGVTAGLKIPESRILKVDKVRFEMGPERMTPYPG